MTKTINTKKESLEQKDFNMNYTLNKNIYSKEEKYSYIKIDPSIIFKCISPSEIKDINEKISKFNKKKLHDKNIQKNHLSTEIIKKFFEKYYYKGDINANKIISLISSQIRSKKKLNRDTMEQYINFFYDEREKYKSSNFLIMNKKIFQNMGIILCYVYGKLKEYPIDVNGIKEYIIEILTKKINILTDYFIYCNNLSNDPMLLKKVSEWRNLVKIKNYKIPPELIFLINLFQCCSKLEINIEFDEDRLNEEDFHLYTITLLNIEYVFPNLETIAINLVHNKLQKFLLEKYEKKLINMIKNGNEVIKKNYIKDNISMYDIKWDFEHDFNLVYYNDIRKKEKRNRKNIILDDYCIISNNEDKDKEFLNKSNISFSGNTLISLEKSSIEQYTKTDENTNIDLDWDELDRDLYSVKSSSNQESAKMKIKENIKEQQTENKIKYYLDKSDENLIIFDFILMTFCGISLNKSVRKLTILSNDFYAKEIIDYMKNFFELDSKVVFHLFDILFNKTNGLDVLNMEINSLDKYTFKKLLELIYINISLTSINLSFFSAEASSSIISLFKIYSEQIKYPKDIKDYIIMKGKYFNIGDFERKILDDISKYFFDYLEMLFRIIKNKKDLKELGLNFDLPTILINNNNYKISIFKFILNIIMLINNNELNNMSNIKKLTLLSPKITFDKKFGINIDNFFKSITLYKSAKTLINLNIEFQFYKISNIKNIISTNLFQLNIGDLDLFTFDKLVTYLTSYQFSSKSNLSHLSIKILGMITNFNTQFKQILQKLFGINLKNMLELNLITNLTIDKKANYLFLIKLLQNNWIPSYTITLNENSKKTIAYFNLFGRKKITYLVSESIQNVIFNNIYSNISKRNNFNGNDVYWILKYMFIRKKKEYSVNLEFFEIKFLIFTILKYLFLTSNIKIEHKYNSLKNSS